jgi:uncharacterized protein YecT (DUF1311 family)
LFGVEAIATLLWAIAPILLGLPKFGWWGLKLEVSDRFFLEAMAMMMQRLMGVLLVGMGLTVPGVAFAQGSPELPNCKKPVNDFERNFCEVKPDCVNLKTQLDMNFCAAWGAELSDRELNAAYQRVRRSYQQSDSKTYRALRLKHLTTAQLAWIKYRDTTCTWKASKFSGGSIEPMIYSGCVDRLTKVRTQELLDDLVEGN